MASRADFEVLWFPFQLNPDAPMEGENKMQMYMNKFHMTKPETVSRMEMMKGKFSEVGLPFVFTEAGLTGNTINGHRLVTFALKEGGAKAQDAVVEELFRNYFGEEKFVNDPAVLTAAGIQAGLPEDKVKQLVEDPNFMLSETKDEMRDARNMAGQIFAQTRDRNARMTGVPYFIFSLEGAQSMGMCGGQPAQVMEMYVDHLLKQVHDE